MEISPQLMQQLQVVFKAELAEHLETMTSGLLALEQGVDTTQQQELLENIFRAAHSLKGAAKGVSQHAIADITHRLESIFSLLKKAQLPYSTALFDTVLQAVDKIKQLSETPDTDSPLLKALLIQLDSCLLGSIKNNDKAVIQYGEVQNPLSSATKKTLAVTETDQRPPSPPVAIADAAPEKTRPDLAASLLNPDSPQTSSTVLAQDVQQLSLIADEVQTSRLQLKKHLLDFQQLYFNLDRLSNHLQERISQSTVSRQNEKLTHSMLELSHLSTHALDSFNNLRQLNNHLHQASHSLTAAVNTMRLVPFAMLLAPLHRIVRDLSLQQQKKLQFVI